MIAQWRDAPIIGGAYGDETLPWSVQDTVNWIPVKAERSGDSLISNAALCSWCTPILRS